MSTDHDRLFKELITTFFKEFMEAFFPETAWELDFNYLEFLGQEVFTDVTEGEKKYIDILVKTRVRGEEGFVLVHVEPQAQKKAGFPRRMFKYFARLFEKYDMRILPVAVLAHGVKKEEPGSFEISFPFKKVLEFNYLQLHLKRHYWRDYIRADNPAAAALLSCMDYSQEEKVQIKLEFLKMMLRMRVDPARMQLLLGFFESYLDLTSREEEIFQQKLKEELPMEEVKEVTEILTSYHLRGKEEGREEGGVLALQSTLLKQARKKFGAVSSETEKLIHETNSSQKLENILENIFEIESENALVDMLKGN